MKIIYVVSLLIGIFGIFQAGLNKQMSLQIGVAHTTLIGMTISFIFGVSLYFLIRENPNLLPSFYEVKKPLSYFKWWFLIPGLMGFFIIFFLPQTINELGAVKVTILIIAGQIISSTIWDYYVEHIQINAFKFLGIFFAALSVVFSVM